MNGSRNSLPALYATILTGFALFAAVLIAPLPGFAQDSASYLEQPPYQSRPLALGRDDETATLLAIAKTLSEVGDGATYVWQRADGRLSGTFKPVRTFRDQAGRLCRDLAIALTTAEYTRRMSGAACRAPDGSWTLKG
jgi:hypothetical protein